MFCPNCGEELANDAAFCPKCNITFNKKAVPPVPPAAAVQPEKKRNVHGKNYAAIASALFVFPTLISFVLDYVWDGNLGWSPYTFGIIMCLWMFAVLPAIKPKHPAVTVSLCLVAISLYLVMLSFLDGASQWYVGYALPITLMLTGSSAVISLLTAYKVLRGMHIFTGISIQAGLLCCGIEVVIDMQKRGAVNLRWSLIWAAIALSAAAVTEAVAYSYKNSKN